MSALAPAPVLVALDLDQTIVFSRRSAGECGPSRVVEIYQGEPISSMTELAIERFEALDGLGLIVPVTTRTPEQFQRIVLPRPPRWAVCSNGGVLLEAGVRDPEWDEWVGSLLALSAPIDHVAPLFEDLVGADWVRLVRRVEDLFCYLVAHAATDFPLDWLETLSERAAGMGWGVSVQGRKAYLVPAALTKAAALARLAERVGASHLLAAGDSLLDRPMLELALASGGAARPAHGELHHLGFSPAGLFVSPSAGADAAAEILEWAIHRVSELARSGAA